MIQLEDTKWGQYIYYLFFWKMNKTLLAWGFWSCKLIFRSPWAKNVIQNIFLRSLDDSKFFSVMSLFSKMENITLYNLDSWVWAWLAVANPLFGKWVGNNIANKVHIFWEGHKIWISKLFLMPLCKFKKRLGISSNFCGLLRTYEL